MKRVAIISDMHCGHRWGLVPPKWQKNKDQAAFWNWYARRVAAVKTAGDIDALICNGDAIDGRGEKSGSKELLTPDRTVQVDMAAECIGVWEAKRIIVVAGTPYHTGKDEDFEKVLAKQVGGSFHEEFHGNIGRHVFNARHFLPATSVPYSRNTAVCKDQMLLRLEGRPADVVVRSHVHYFTAPLNSAGLCVVTPCLQIDSSYGKKQCSGEIDVGFVVLDVYRDRVVPRPKLMEEI